MVTAQTRQKTVQSQFSLDFPRSLRYSIFHLGLQESDGKGILENRLAETSQGFESLTLRRVNCKDWVGFVA